MGGRALRSDHIPSRPLNGAQGMSLLDQLTERTEGRGPKECATCYALRVLDEHTADKFCTVLAMPPSAVKSSEVARAFAECGIQVGPDSVRRHRNGVGTTCAS